MFRGSTTTALAVLIEDNSAGSPAHICTGGGSESGIMWGFHSHARCWYELICGRSAAGQEAVCKQFMTMSNRWAEAAQHSQTEQNQLSPLTGPFRFVPNGAHIHFY